MPDNEVTLGELARSLSSLETRMNGRFDAVNQRLDGLQFVHRETYTVQMGAVIDDIKELQEGRKWFNRLLATAFLVAFVAPVLVALVVTRQ